jgi:murein L,D-transpeptidase YafK
MKLTVPLLTVVALTGAGSVVMFKPQSRAVARETAAASDTNSDPKTVNKTPLKLPLAEPRIEVSKSKRELVLYSANKVVRVYRVGLGSNPKDDKRMQGDGRTPEGGFYVCSKNAKSSYYLSLGLSYPNEEDAERGLR